MASDARLASLAASGSRHAMSAIFERHHQALQRYCFSLLGNSHDAADALQNTMIKALRALPGEHRQIALRPWLYRIAHNESISLLRSRRPDSDLDVAAELSDSAAAGALESRERLRSLTEDLSELTERQRGALLMRELGGLEFAEVAEALGTSASAVKQSVYEARCALQAMQEGRAMDCESVRRVLSDGDRRRLRGMRMRGHLRGCACCSEFEIALRARPAQLMAMIPPLPVAAATAMLHGLLGGGGSGGGGGLAVGLAGTAKVTTGISLGAKAAAVVAVSTTLAGGAVYGVPQLQGPTRDRSTSRSEQVVGAGKPRAVPAKASFEARRLRGSAAAPPFGHGAGAPDGTRPGSAQPTASPAPVDTAGGNPAGAGRPVTAPGGASSAAGATGKAGKAGKTGKPQGGRPSGTGKPAGTPGGGRPADPPGGGKPAGTPGGKPAGAGKPATSPGGKPSEIPVPSGGSAAPAGTPGASGAAPGRP